VQKRTPTRLARSGPDSVILVRAAVQLARATSAGVPEPMLREGRTFGVTSAVGHPVVVRGETWGAIVIAAVRGAEPRPSAIEARLSQFADLVATALVNAEARRKLERLAASRRRCGAWRPWSRRRRSPPASSQPR
jgi:GAF domain-containing protein